MKSPASIQASLSSVIISFDLPLFTSMKYKSSRSCTRFTAVAQSKPLRTHPKRGIRMLEFSPRGKEPELAPVTVIHLSLPPSELTTPRRTLGLGSPGCGYFCWSTVACRGIQSAMG